VKPGTDETSFTNMKSKWFRELWSIVLLAGTGTVVCVVAEGWFGPGVNVMGLLVGGAAAFAGLIGVARLGDDEETRN
jgi:hypothetical protein